MTAIEITGGAGDDVLTVGPGSIAIVFDGGGGSDAVAGSTAHSTWNVTGAGLGSVAGVSFSNIEHLRGAAGHDDTFVFEAAGSLIGTVEGGDGGYDTVEVAANGSSLTSTITGPQSGTIARGSDVIAYSGMEPLTIHTTSTVTINAPADATIVVTESGTATDKTFSVTFGGGGETHVITNADTVTSLTLNLGTGTNAVTLEALDPAFNGTITITGGSGSDTVTFLERTGGTYTFNGGGGDDTLVGTDDSNVWTVTGANAGNLNGDISFTNVENLVGGASDDGFVLSPGGSVESLDGAGSDPDADVLDVLSYATRTTAIFVTLDTSSATDVGAFMSIDLVRGSLATTDSILGETSGSAFVVAGPNSGDVDGLAYDGVETLTGGPGEDTFEVQAGGAISGGIHGAGGDDTLVGPNDSATWRVTEPNEGLLNATSFEDIELLLGGNANDLFRIEGTGEVASIDGGPTDAGLPSSNTLDYSMLAGPVTVELLTPSGPGVGVFARIDRIVGTSGDDDTLEGPAATLDQVTWTISGVDTGDVEGLAFVGFENLTGDDGSDDAFVFLSGGSISGTIAGGTGGLDGFAVAVADGLRAFQPDDPDESDTDFDFSGKEISYSGMDEYNPLQGTTADQLVIGSIFDGTFTVGDSGVLGQLIVTFAGLRFALTDAGTDSSTFTFDRPTATLTVTSGSGDDTATIANLSPTFAGGVITYSAGVVTAKLSTTADAVSISAGSLATDGSPIVDLVVNGLTRTFGAAGAGVGSVHVYGNGGDDTFAVDDLIAAPIEIFGNDGSDELTGPDADFEWVLTGEDAGTVGGNFIRFDGVENLTGGTGIDRFILSAGSVKGEIDGGGGSGSTGSSRPTRRRRATRTPGKSRAPTGGRSTARRSRRSRSWWAAARTTPSR